MAATVSVFIATSLDGYISTPDGGIAWLERANALVLPGEDCGYQAFFDSVDTLVVGRNTFEQVLRLPQWPYAEHRVIVMTSHPERLPLALPETVAATAESPDRLVARLNDEGAKHIYVDGGVTIQRFLRANLIDEMTITTIPIILGAGRPLFGQLDSSVTLKHVSTITYTFGFVQTKYRIVPE